MADRKRRVLYFDLLNICACFAVVALHCNGCFWQFDGDADYWRTSIIIEAICYWAVPIFVMLSGAKLLDYRERQTTKEFIMNRIKKSFFPFMCWSLFAVFVYKGTSVISLEELVNLIITEPIISIYWFFPMIFIMYSIIPLISIIPKDRRVNIYIYITMLAFVCYSIYPIFCKLVLLNSASVYEIPGYIVYLLLGWILANVKVEKKCRLLIYLLGFASLFLRGVTVLEWSLRDGMINNTMGGYLNFPTVFLAVAVFIWFKYQNWSFFQAGDRREIVQKLSGASLGIYLMHMYFVEILPIVLQFSNKSWLFRTVGALSVYFLCLCIVLVMKKVPIISRVVP